MSSDYDFKGYVLMCSARQYLQRHDWDNAAHRFQEAIQTGLSKAETIEAHYGLGIAYVGLGDLVLAEQEYRTLKEPDGELEKLAEELAEKLNQVICQTGKEKDGQ